MEQDTSSAKNILILGYLVSIIFWNVSASILSFLVLVVLKHKNIPPHKSILVGAFSLALIVTLDIAILHKHPHIVSFLKDGFLTNKTALLLLSKYDAKLALVFLFRYEWQYYLGCPLLLASLLHGLNNIFLPAHAAELNKIGKGKFSFTNSRNHSYISRKLTGLKDSKYDGCLLGLSLRNFRPVVIPDSYINQILLVLGTTGSGKTITLRRFYQRAIRQKYPLIIIDGKPTAENVTFIENLAKQNDRSFYGFNCGNYVAYNPFSNGNYTEIKDKIITLKDKWESDYYRTIAEDYLQTTLEVLLKAKRKIDLKEIIACLNYDTLVERARFSQEQVLAEKVNLLKHYPRESLTGFQAHLNILMNSELGGHLSSDPQALSLNEAIEQKAVMYFALPALKFPTFASMLGKLIINDIKTAIEPLDGTIPLFVIFDEFSIFAGEQVLNLVNMGRGKGLHTIFGTQGLADLEKVSPQFEGQLLNCVNSVICHRLNNQKCAESISKWIGTQDSYDITAQINIKDSCSSLGSATKNKAFLVHPDEIKQLLKTGEAIYATKVVSFCFDIVKIKISL